MRSFLKDVAGVHQDIIKFYQTLPHGLFGVGIDAVAAQDAWGFDLPGFDGLNLDPSPGKGMNRDAIPNEEAEKYFFHFPDGNATIARLLVRKLIPDAIPGNSSSDVILAKANYAKLDDSSSPVRIRLNSTAVRVKHLGDAASAKEVEVSYARGGKVYTAKAKNSILACWHVVIPYICGELPDKQKEALASAQKVPLLYTNVALRNWTSFQKLGVNSVYAPGMYHTGVNLDLPVSIGGYECARKPDEPIVVHMMKAACHPGLPARQQHMYGRMELYTTTFETMERKIRDQLARTLGPGGFDPARDIAPSQSTAGRTATPTNTTRSSIHSGSKAARPPAKSHASPTDGSPSPTPTPAPTPTQMKPSTRHGEPSAKSRRANLGSRVYVERFMWGQPPRLSAERSSAVVLECQSVFWPLSCAALFRASCACCCMPLA